jgi:hypothetical protein
MAKWKLFGKSKKEGEIKPKDSFKEETQVVIEKESGDKPLAEYSETLETVSTSKKKSVKKYPTPSDQRIWRDVNSIEDKVDNLHITRAQKPVTELERKVDTLVSSVIIENNQKTRKSSNVIYVVSSPQPGEVRGDWGVRDHDKFFSHHKTKEKAIEEARNIAKKKGATVMVQNTDGTFSDGFKPRQ